MTVPERASPVRVPGFDNTPVTADCMDTVIVDTTLLTFADGSPGIVEDGAVGIAGDELAYVGPTSEFDPGDAEEVDRKSVV